MEHILIFDKTIGRGIDIDILDDGRIVSEIMYSQDFESE